MTFTIDACLPTVVITNPTNTTYPHANVQLIYTVSNERAMYIYLNGMVNTIDVPSGSVVSDFPGAPAIPDGSYNITIVVEDYAGSIDSNTIFFTIETPTGPEIQLYGTFVNETTHPLGYPCYQSSKEIV